MTPELIVINNIEGIKALSSYLDAFDYVVLDTETTGLSTSHEVIGFSICTEEAKAFYVELAWWDAAQNKLLYQYGSKLYPSATELLKKLQTKKLIGHNIIFDCMMIEANFKIKLIDNVHTDTMILAHLLDENRRVGLKELASSMYGESSTLEMKVMKESIVQNGGQVTKANYEMYKADRTLLAKYGAKDALLTYKLFTDLVPQLYDQGLDKFFYEDESMPLLRGPTYDLNTVGLQIDTNNLTKLKKKLEAECLEAKNFIYQEINPYIITKYPGTNKKNVFNIGSSQQLSWLIFGELGLDFNTLTKKGKEICKSLGLPLPYTKSAQQDFIRSYISMTGKEPWKYIACDKKTLGKLAAKYKWIDRLLEYNRKQKLLNTYICGTEERMYYGVIRPSYLQHGTKSGRYSSRNPNYQNLPREDQRIKECIVARQGRVFISADYSQLEPRTFAFYSQDPKLMSAFDGTSDFYSVVGMEVFDKHDCTPQKDGSDAFGVKYKKLRDLSKVIALASAYGATPGQLAPATGKSKDDTAKDMAKYFDKFPGVRNMMLEAHNLAKEKGFVTNLYGRPRRIPEAMRIHKKASHWDLPYDQRNVLNQACNHRIQSTGASIVNRAAIRFHSDCKELNLNCKIVSQIHDELVIEGDEQDAEIISKVLQNAMENTCILNGVPLEAKPRISKSLAK